MGCLFAIVIKRKPLVPYCYETLFEIKVYGFMWKKLYELDCKHSYPSSEHILFEKEVTQKNILPETIAIKHFF